MENRVYEIVKENVLRRLEDALEHGGEFCWVRPWSAGYAYPKSYTTGKAYRGINRILLMPGEYITYKQLIAAAKKNFIIRLKEDSIAWPVFYYNRCTRKDSSGKVICNQDGTEKYFYFMRYYRVYNLEDIEGIEPHEPLELFDYPISERALLADKSVEDYVMKEEIRLNHALSGNRAYYTTSTHSIAIPDKRRFGTEEGYYSTLFHELVHSTGKHFKRLDNIQDINNYAKEELVAEIGASMLCAQFGFNSVSCDDNAVAYLKHWASRIKENGGKWVVTAASKAQSAVDYILGIEPEVGPTEICE